MKAIIPILLVLPLFADFESVSDKNIIAATLILEAGGERADGAMEAVYEVIYNRAIIRRQTEREIVLARLQFSCWNNADRRLELYEHARRHPRWMEAVRIVNSPVTNLTGGACHYHAISVNPSWASALNRTTQIGGHLFYNLR